jgi:hypothetical protein
MKVQVSGHPRWDITLTRSKKTRSPGYLQRSPEKFRSACTPPGKNFPEKFYKKSAIKKIKKIFPSHSRKRLSRSRQERLPLTVDPGQRVRRDQEEPPRPVLGPEPELGGDGLIQLTMSGPERIFDIAIISKIPVTFCRVMFAPAILATVYELADYYRQEIAQLRIIARDAAITAELWIRSKHGTWRFFLDTPDSLVEIDREGKRIESGQTIPYLAGIALGERGSTPS